MDFGASGTLTFNGAEATGIGGTIQYYDTDALGSVRLMTDAGGQVVATTHYLPFGDDWQATAPLEARVCAQMEQTADTGTASWGPLITPRNATTTATRDGS